MKAGDKDTKGCCGYCRLCQCDHFLQADPAREACLELMAQLEKKQNIDIFARHGKKNPRCSTASLFGDARGKMFGVMVARDIHGQIQRFRAFSGQYNGLWEVPGWVEPAFELKAFHAVHDPREREIKSLSKKIRNAVNSAEQQELIRQRKSLSQQLMKMIHALYVFRNFSGQQATLAQIFPAGQGIPTGTGDCCAPKLLHYAAKKNLRPVSIAEFFWGRENASSSRKHGCFYPSCSSKCYPLLGFILCGLRHD